MLEYNTIDIITVGEMHDAAADTAEEMSDVTIVDDDHSHARARSRPQLLYVRTKISVTYIRDTIRRQKTLLLDSDTAPLSLGLRVVTSSSMVISWLLMCGGW